MTGPLSPITSLWAEAWRLACLLGWKWAQHDLQRKDPSHRDLPEIVLAIRRLQR